MSTTILSMRASSSEDKENSSIPLCGGDKMEAGKGAKTGKAVKAKAMRAGLGVREGNVVQKQQQEKKADDTKKPLNVVPAAKTKTEKTATKEPKKKVKVIGVQTDSVDRMEDGDVLYMTTVDLDARVQSRESQIKELQAETESFYEDLISYRESNELIREVIADLDAETKELKEKYEELKSAVDEARVIIEAVQ